jgi:cytochrome c-type biogenesis protein CcsB
MDITIILFYLAILCYLISTFQIIIYFLRFKEKNLNISRKFFITAFIIHCISFFSRWISCKFFPVTTLFESLSFFALIIALFQIIIDYRYKVKGISIFSSIIISILVIISCLLPYNIVALPPVLNSFWLPVHVFFAFLGNGIFAISFAVSILYLIQFKKVKEKKLSESFFKLPSLESLDSLNYRCLTIGFPLLTLGIITGSLWASSAWGSYWSWDPKETWSLITWFLYAALLHGRLNTGWRGKKGAIFSIIGFAVVVFTFLGVNLLLPGLHSYAVR